MEKIPPYSEQAERSVLGSILLDYARVLFLCREKHVTADTFYVPAHAKTMEAVLDISRDNTPINIITLCESLGDDIEKIGGEAMLHSLIDTTPTAAHAEYYINIIKKKAKQREIINLSRKAEADAFENTDPEEILATVVSVSAGIATEKEHKTSEDYHQEHIARRNAARNGECGYNVPAWLSDLISFWHPPHNVVLAGESTTGKTTLALDFILPQLEQGIPIGFVSLDMTEYDLRERLAAKMAGVNNHVFTKSYWRNEDALDMDAAWETLNKHPLYVLDDATASGDDIISWTTAMVARYGIKFLVVDFLQNIPRAPHEMRQDRRITVSENVYKLKALGKRFDLVTMILSQIARSSDRKKTSTPHRPTAQAVKESGDIEQAADIIIMVSWEEDMPWEDFTYKNPVWDMNVDVLKQRNGPTDNRKVCRHVTRHKFVSREQGDEIRREIESHRESQTNGLPF